MAAVAEAADAADDSMSHEASHPSGHQPQRHSRSATTGGAPNHSSWSGSGQFATQEILRQVNTNTQHGSGSGGGVAVPSCPSLSTPLHQQPRRSENGDPAGMAVSSPIRPPSPLTLPSHHQHHKHSASLGRMSSIAAEGVSSTGAPSSHPRNHYAALRRGGTVSPGSEAFDARSRASHTGTTPNLANLAIYTTSSGAAFVRSLSQQRQHTANSASVRSTSPSNSSIASTSWTSPSTYGPNNTGGVFGGGGGGNFSPLTSIDSRFSGGAPSMDSRDTSMEGFSNSGQISRASSASASTSQHEFGGGGGSMASSTSTPPLGIRHRHKSKLLNIDRKRICIHHLRNPKLKQEELARIFNIERSTVSKVLKEQERWLAVPDDSEDALVGKHRNPRFPELEEHLAAWAHQAQASGQTLTDSTLRKKALEIAQRLPDESSGKKFKASGGWVEKFRARAGLKKGGGPGTATATATTTTPSIDSIDEQPDGEVDMSVDVAPRRHGSSTPVRGQGQDRRGSVNGKDGPASTTASTTPSSKQKRQYDAMDAGESLAMVNEFGQVISPVGGGGGISLQQQHAQAQGQVAFPTMPPVHHSHAQHASQPTSASTPFTTQQQLQQLYTPHHHQPEQACHRTHGGGGSYYSSDSKRRRGATTGGLHGGGDGSATATAHHHLGSPFAEQHQQQANAANAMPMPMSMQMVPSQSQSQTWPHASLPYTPSHRPGELHPQDGAGVAGNAEFGNEGGGGAGLPPQASPTSPLRPLRLSDLGKSNTSLVSGNVSGNGANARHHATPALASRVHMNRTRSDVPRDAAAAAASMDMDGIGIGIDEGISVDDGGEAVGGDAGGLYGAAIYGDDSVDDADLLRQHVLHAQRHPRPLRRLLKPGRAGSNDNLHNANASGNAVLSEVSNASAVSGLPRTRTISSSSASSSSSTRGGGGEKTISVHQARESLDVVLQFINESDEADIIPRSHLFTLGSLHGSLTAAAAAALSRGRERGGGGERGGGERSGSSRRGSSGSGGGSGRRVMMDAASAAMRMRGTARGWKESQHRVDDDDDVEEQTNRDGSHGHREHSSDEQEQRPRRGSAMHERDARVVAAGRRSPSKQELLQHGKVVPGEEDDDGGGESRRDDGRSGLHQQEEEREPPEQHGRNRPKRRATQRGGAVGGGRA